MEYVTKIVHEYNDIVGKLTPAEVRIVEKRNNRAVEGEKNKSTTDDKRFM